MLATEVRAGDAPKPPFPMKIYKNQKNQEIDPPSTIEISPYFWVCMKSMGGLRGVDPHKYAGEGGWERVGPLPTS